LPLGTLASHVDSVSYTRSEGRYSPKDAYAGGMLTCPLRELDTDIAITTAITICCEKMSDYGYYADGMSDVPCMRRHLLMTTDYSLTFRYQSGINQTSWRWV
jgi:hypothetical protein